MFPDFFQRAPTLRMFDPLARLLGAPADGILEFQFADVVRQAGHSCPTVASAFLMTRRALLALYADELPRRGDIRVDLREPETQGVTGVIAAVASQITGAAGPGGFQGIGGRFARRNLLHFAQAMDFGTLRLTRLDTGAQAEVRADLSRLPPDPALSALFASVLSGQASAQDEAAFQAGWQQRVDQLLTRHADDAQSFPLKLTPA